MKSMYILSLLSISCCPVSYPSLAENRGVLASALSVSPPMHLSTSQSPQHYIHTLSQLVRSRIIRILFTFFTSICTSHTCRALQGGPEYG